MTFTNNDVLLIHNIDVLSYAFDSVGNHRFQVCIDIYRSSFLLADERKDTNLCEKIVNDIVNTICTKSEPNGRFLEFDEKKNVWYNVGTGAIPCHIARTALLGLLSKTMNSKCHADKPILEMSKTMRARTMKALRFNEIMLRSVINLNDERFKVKDKALINDAMCTPKPEKKSSPKRSYEKRASLSDSILNNDIVSKKEEKISKRRRIICSEVQRVDVTCGGVGDKCRFVEQKEKSNKLVELSYQDNMEKTIQTFCNQSLLDEYLSDKEIENFMTSFDDTNIYDSYVDTPNDAPSSAKHAENELLITTDEAFNDILLTILNEESKPHSYESMRLDHFIMNESTRPFYAEEQNEYLDSPFRVVDGNIEEFIKAETFLESLLV